MDVFYIDWLHLGDADDTFGSKSDNHLKVKDSTSLKHLGGAEWLVLTTSITWSRIWIQLEMKYSSWLYGTYYKEPFIVTIPSSQLR